MKVFIWKNVEKLTTNYHSGGGLVVIAPTLEEARFLAFARDLGYRVEEDDMTPPDERENLRQQLAITTDPDVTYELTDGQGAGGDVFVFPNAGCC